MLEAPTGTGTGTGTGTLFRARGAISEIEKGTPLSFAKARGGQYPPLVSTFLV